MTMYQKRTAIKNNETSFGMRKQKDIRYKNIMTPFLVRIHEDFNY